MPACFCGSGLNFSQCCEPLLLGKVPASSPEALMRSRYSAFCTQNLDYIVATTDPQARLDMHLESTKSWMTDSVFTKLEVLKSTDEGNKGTVEFKASFTTNGVPEVHHEVSKFRKQSGVWYFRDGKVRESSKPS